MTDTHWEDSITHHYADSDGVRIYYASLGAGPLLVMLHGFPDFWYSWRYQMPVLAANYQVVALDLRGYNLSDRPAGVENYAMRLLIGDVAAVIHSLGRERAMIVGHDWGGSIAWNFAMYQPQMTEKLIVLNQPHPRGFMRELTHNLVQQGNSQYARDYQREGAHLDLTAERLAAWHTDPAVRERYVAAFQRSDFEAMLNFYKRNYAREPYREPTSPVVKVHAPVLMVHGLRDEYLLASGLNNTWEWVEQDLTIVTVPQAGHFVQHDAPELVTRVMRSWLARDKD